MSEERNGTTIQVRGGRAETWTAKNPVLAVRELGYETDTGLHKLGDGVTPWRDLPYTPSGGDDGSAMIALMEHINADEPHPAYDDGPSLLLAYENAKAG